MQEFTARRAELLPVTVPEPAKQPSGSRRRNRLLGLACAAVAVLSLLASDGLLRGAALLGAGLELPQGVGSLLRPRQHRTVRRQQRANSRTLSHHPAQYRPQEQTRMKRRDSSR